jgi:hypothetical protein
MAARPGSASLLASHRVRVMVWVQTSRNVPVSNSRAISGAPQKVADDGGGDDDAADAEHVHDRVGAGPASSRKLLASCPQPPPWQPVTPSERFRLARCDLLPTGSMTDPGAGRTADDGWPAVPPPAASSRCGHAATWTPVAPLPSRPGGARKLTGRFFDSFRDGDVDGLRALLAADVRPVGDGGGKTPQFATQFAGAENVARVLAALISPFVGIGGAVEPRQVNGQPGAIFRDRDGKVVNTWTLDILGGQI